MMTIMEILLSERWLPAFIVVLSPIAAFIVDFLLSFVVFVFELRNHPLLHRVRPKKNKSSFHQSNEAVFLFISDGIL